MNSIKQITLVVAISLCYCSLLAKKPERTELQAQHETIIWSSEEPFPLEKTVDTIAKQVNEHLNNPFFHTKFVCKPSAVKSYFMNHNCGKGKPITCKTSDNEKISCVYFDRGSNNLLVIGPGFTNPLEYMAPFVGMFNCDIALFNYRGHGYSPTKWYNPFSWKLKPAQIFFTLESSKVKMGEVEHNDVIAVVETFRKQKQYKQVCGLGICYSSLIFIKAQAIYKEETGKNLFDKFIGDGTWLSLANQVERISNDFKLLGNPQEGGFSGKWPMSRPWINKGIQWSIEKLACIPFSKLNINILDYIDKVDIPLLFFHSKYDLFVPLNEFITTWQHAASEQKVAVLTSNPHVRNHFKQKELYKLLCDLFMELPYEEFMHHMHNPKAIVEHEIGKYQEKLAQAITI